MNGNYDAKTGIDGEDVYYYIPVPDEVNEYFLKLIMWFLGEEIWM